MVEITDRIEGRFWAKVDKTGACWVWRAGVSSSGYGAFHVGDRTLAAHRVAYQIHTGVSRPPSTLVLHQCDNPLCVNPAHLREGTHQDNARDKVSQGRQARGARNGRAKVGVTDVLSIRRRHVLGESISRLSREYAISRRTVRMILTRETWTHI